MQFTLKNPLAVHRAFELMKERGKVELIWGPLRHGAGHNIVFYFRDYTGNIVEYSAEEEIIAGPRKNVSTRPLPTGSVSRSNATIGIVEVSDRTA